MIPETSGRSALLTAESLVEHLCEGPLRTVLTLHVRAVLLVSPSETDGDQRLEKLVELLQLARMAMAQFQDFTGELQRLIDQLAAAKGRIQ